MIGPILVVEDKDAKFEAILLAIRSLDTLVEVSRAQTVVEGERAVRNGKWSLMLLDISMDISGDSRGGALSGGHANLGGIDIVETMFYEGIVIPTIVVTGFDYFIAEGSGADTDYIGIPELEALVRTKMPEGYLGHVRYGVDGWANRLTSICEAIKW